MKINSKIILFFIIAGFLFIVSSCMKKEEYPVIPSIKFENFRKIQNDKGIDVKGILDISFTDGDGDIGLSPTDTIAPYDYNFFINYFEKRKGIFQKINFEGVSFNSRIPYIIPEGENKPVKGEIEDTLFINNRFDPEAYPDFDTIYFEAYILDRALNKSNTIKTPVIIVKKQ